MDIKPPMVISLAKREEEIYMQGRAMPFKLSRTSAALKLLQFARDEAHRFAQSYHHLLIAHRQFQDTLRGSTGKLKIKRKTRSKAADTEASKDSSTPTTDEFKVLSEQEIRDLTAKPTAQPP